MTYVRQYCYKLLLGVRTLRQQDAHGRWQQRTPARPAGLSEKRVHDLPDGVRYPAVQVAWATAPGEAEAESFRNS